MSYDRGGLEIADLVDMRVTLLVKWIYHCGNDRDRLWRRVVCAKSGLDLNSLALTFNRSSRRSTLTNTISSFLDKNERACVIFQGGFRHLIGNWSNSVSRETI